MAWNSITKEGLVNAIDTYRIFEASYDFWDESGDGWKVLEGVQASVDYISPADVEATVEFLLWIIQSSSLDIKANYHMSRVLAMMRTAGPGIADAMGLLLGLAPTGAMTYDKLFPEERDKRVLLGIIINRSWDSVKLLLTLGANPHHVYINNGHSPFTETPFSLAMYSSWAFWAFRNILRGIDLDVEDIARQELKQGSPLFDAGWQTNTLRALLEFEFEPDIEPPESYWYVICDYCCSPLSGVAVQPYWQGVLESIKNGTYQRRYYLDTQDEQTSNSRSNLAATSKESLASITSHSMLAQGPALSGDQAAQPDEKPSVNKDDTLRRITDRTEIWCMDCWCYYKETGYRWSPATTETESSDGDDFSPLLFNT